MKLKEAKKDRCDEVALDLKMKEIVQYVIKVSPYLLVCHNVFDKQVGYFIQKARYGIENLPIPSDFPGFRIAYLDVFSNDHGYIHLSVNEARKDVEETNR